MQLISVNAGRVAPFPVAQSGTQHRFVSAIDKQPVAGSVHVGRLGVAGDEQADLTVHGGLDKAVYAYPVEHYAFWKALRLAACKQEQPLPFGSMGENLSLSGLLEQDAWIGDRLLIGSVVLQVTEPRRPCFKFNARMGFSHATKSMVQSGFTGFYLRVLQTGTLQAGDAVILQPGMRQVSLAAINARRWHGRQQELF